MRIMARIAIGVVALFCVSSARVQVKEIVAYYPEWGARYNRYYVKDLEKRGAADKLTVLIYAFAEPGPDSSGVIIPKFMSAFEAYQRVYSTTLSVDGVKDDLTQHLRGQFNQLKKLKTRHPNLKILISIGGWTGSKYFSDAMLTPESREKFADAIINNFILGNLPFVDGAGGTGVASNIFDGIDIDWEYPVAGGTDDNHYNPNDNNNLSAFYSLLRKKFDSINPRLIITAAVPSSEKNANHYNIKEDQRYLNWYNLMTYDYAGEWVTTTNHHTNLLTSPNDTAKVSLSFDGSVRLFVDSFDVSREKIVPGAAFYGHGWKNVDSTNNGLYQRGDGVDLSDSEANSIDYSYWSSLLSKGFEFHWDTLAMAPSLYSKKDRAFWTFDDAKSVALKSRYVEAYHLDGIMCWEISGDDSSGTLINAMYSREMPDASANRLHYRVGPPHVRLYLTSSHDQLIEGSNVILNTEVAARKAPVVKVEFFVDGKSIGYDTEAPFDWVWFNAQRGKHRIKVVAMDSEDNKQTSNVVNVVIKDIVR